MGNETYLPWEAVFLDGTSISRLTCPRASFTRDVLSRKRDLYVFKILFTEMPVIQVRLTDGFVDWGRGWERHRNHKSDAARYDVLYSVRYRGVHRDGRFTTELDGYTIGWEGSPPLSARLVLRTNTAGTVLDTRYCKT